MTEFRFHPDAEAELLQHITYYEEVEPSLGQDFALETYKAVQRATSYPQAWAKFDGEVRRCLVHRFPFGVLYSEEEEGILVLAVMHLHR